MSSKKDLDTKRKKLSSTVKTTLKKSPKSLPETQLSQDKVKPKPKKPELSVVNVIEQIALILRKEIRDQERKKVSGE